MKSLSFYISSIIIFFSISGAFAADAGSRASFTRGGWVGAKYVATGMTAETTADDVFSIYWNPAGLTELKGSSGMSLRDIQKKARDGKVEDVSESDLTRFSEESGERFFLQIGISAARLDIERNANFAGFACKLFDGVFGMGVYSIYSLGIEGRDESGNYTRDYDYIASVGYLSYAFTIGGIASFGFSAKVLYEKIGDVAYAGAGADVGLQVFVLPFLKIGFMAQDLGSGLYPVEDYPGIKKKYDFAFPTLRLGAAFINNSGLTVSFSVIKKLEQKAFYYGLGVEYDLMRYTSIYLGFSGSQFTSGITIHIANVDISYAFMFDNIRNGYNNIVSLTTLF